MTPQRKRIEEEIDEEVEQLRKETQTDHDRLILIQATMKAVTKKLDEINGLPCRSNDPSVNPVFRLRIVEKIVRIMAVVLVVVVIVLVASEIISPAQLFKILVGI